MWTFFLHLWLRIAVLGKSHIHIVESPLKIFLVGISALPIRNSKFSWRVWPWLHENVDISCDIRQGDIFIKFEVSVSFRCGPSGPNRMNRQTDRHRRGVACLPLYGRPRNNLSRLRICCGGVVILWDCIAVDPWYVHKPISDVQFIGASYVLWRRLNVWRHEMLFTLSLLTTHCHVSDIFIKF